MIGIPYARNTDDGRAVICPVCGERIELHTRKDFESFKGDEYAVHYEKNHASDAPQEKA